MPRLTAIIQSRLSSSRLPGKSLAEVCGRPLIQRVYERVELAELEHIVIAVPDTPANDKLAEFVERKGWNLYRGPEDDVLARYVGAAKAFDADPIARVTADCPLLDPGVLRGVTEMFALGEFDYVSNVLERTFPDGLDVEVFSRSALIAADESTQDSFEREHPTEFITRHPERFRLGNLRCPEALSAHRWTVDHEADLALVRAVYFAFRHKLYFTSADIIAFLDSHPEVYALNRST